MCSRDQGSREPMEGPVWAHFMALPLPHTPTRNNDLYFPKPFLLFHTSVPLYMLFFLPEMTFSSWQTPPPHRLSWRVSSSTKCPISPKADFFLPGPPQTWCPSLLTAHTAVSSMSLTGPWTFIAKWSKWWWWSLWPSSLRRCQHRQYGHSFWWAWCPRGYLGENRKLEVDLAWHTVDSQWMTSLSSSSDCSASKWWQGE